MFVDADVIFHRWHVCTCCTMVHGALFFVVEFCVLRSGVFFCLQSCLLVYHHLVLCFRR
jgi:hypothetical protein